MRKDIAMIDMITIAGVYGYRHYSKPSGSKADEDRFYAEYGDSNIIRFAAWLTSIDLILKRVAATENAAALRRNPAAVRAVLLRRLFLRRGERRPVLRRCGNAR